MVVDAVKTKSDEVLKLDELAEWRVRPVSMAHEHVLPVVAPLAPLLPDGALSRGSTVSVSGSGATSLALALATGPAEAGSWVAVVGVPSIGWVAAAEAGLPFERLVVVDEPPADRWSTVVAALVGAFDVILVAPRHRVRLADARRLASRARERGSVFVQLPGSVATSTSRSNGHTRRAGQPGLESDIRLHVDDQQWVGLGDGHGHLQARRVEVSASGRGRASQPRHAVLHLPLSSPGEPPDAELASFRDPMQQWEEAGTSVVGVGGPRAHELAG